MPNPTLDEIWQGDLLNRREDAQILFDFLVRRHRERLAAGQSGAYVVNLNAGWGVGKTFFMERLQRQMQAAGHLTASVNAWRDDSSKEPVIAVMAAIESALKPHLGKSKAARQAFNAAKANSASIVVSLAKGAGRQLAKKFVGDGVEEIEEIFDQQNFVSEDVDRALEENAKDVIKTSSEEITSLLTKYVDKKLSDYRTRIESSNTFQYRMRQVLKNLDKKPHLNMPFFVLIDELDRCRPTYAIEMLEQVKHLFDIDNTIFIIATDGDQLAHSIKSVYGEGFDGKKYLLRFFHRHYKFERRELGDFVDYLFKTNSIDMSKLNTPFSSSPVDIFVGAMRRYQVTLRDAEQCFDILRSIITVWKYKVPIELSIIIPLIIQYQRHDTDSMEKYMNSVDTPDTRSSVWTVMAPTAEHGQRVKKLTSVESLNVAVLHKARTSLRDIFEYSRGSPAANYVCDVLQNEMQVVHGNVIGGDGPKSIINDYPQIVQRIGRLTAAI